MDLFFDDMIIIDDAPVAEAGLWPDPTAPFAPAQTQTLPAEPVNDDDFVMTFRMMMESEDFRMEADVDNFEFFDPQDAEDRLGNHEIQRLMQIMNQNDTLEKNVRKKTDDTANAIIGKI
jgi:hypothetical protein